MKVLITGANGQLGGEFQRYLQRTGSYQIVALDKKKLDVSDFSVVLEALSYHKPDIVLNCSAYNLVDKAEEDFDTAFKVNATGVKNLAFSCRKNNALLVHYSTDYIFDGTKENLYTEDDTPNPINNYGRSKLLGERFLAEQTNRFLLFRVSWVFGKGKQNFLYKLAEWSKKSHILKIVCDQISVPTYTEDIVKFTMLAIENGLKGIYHLTNSGYGSRYEVARYFMERLGWDGLILPVSSGYFPTPARRPYFSAMSSIRLSKILGRHLPDWRDAIDRFVRTMED